MARHEQADLLAGAARRLQSAPDEQLTARTVTSCALDLVPGADWASLTIRSARQRYTTVASTSAEAEQADHQQYALREGPCVDAASGEGWNRSGAVREDPRWPRWGPRAADLGVASSLSIRLATDEGLLGSLNLYSRRPGRFAERDDVDLAVLYGAHVAIALTAAREIDGLNTALLSRHTIGLAQGILVERLGLSVDASLALLRRYSSELNIRVVDIAAEVIATARKPQDPPPDV